MEKNRYFVITQITLPMLQEDFGIDWSNESIKDLEKRVGDGDIVQVIALNSNRDVAVAFVKESQDNFSIPIEAQPEIFGESRERIRTILEQKIRNEINQEINRILEDPQELVEIFEKIRKQLEVDSKTRMGCN